MIQLEGALGTHSTKLSDRPAAPVQLWRSVTEEYPSVAVEIDEEVLKQASTAHDDFPWSTVKQSKAELNRLERQARDLAEKLRAG